MIFRHFEDEQNGAHSYLIASPASREAAIVNPNLATIGAYGTTLSELGLRLVYTLRTHRNCRCEEAARKLELITGARRLSPANSAGHADLHDDAIVGSVITLGDLKIGVIDPPRGYSGDVAYRVAWYTFAGSSVLIDFHEGPSANHDASSAVRDQPRVCSTKPATDTQTRPIENFRPSREGVCVERLILEDLHSSLADGLFTPKEKRVVTTYIRCLEEKAYEHPSAIHLAEQLGDVDRTGVHVLVHNIRWKQIDAGRLPLVLAGQTSKWLRGLQTRPEFTAHECEFLGAYLRWMDEHDEPPSGPEIAEALGGGRSVQWVRKRAHTIRRKQREFDMPQLLLSRKQGDPRDEAEAREAEPAGRNMRFEPGCSAGA